MLLECGDRIVARMQSMHLPVRTDAWTFRRQPAEGQSARARVRHGPGVPRELGKRIFEPGFSTKDTGGGLASHSPGESFATTMAVSAAHSPNGATSTYLSDEQSERHRRARVGSREPSPSHAQSRTTRSSSPSRGPLLVIAGGVGKNGGSSLLASPVSSGTTALIPRAFSR